MSEYVYANGELLERLDFDPELGYGMTRRDVEYYAQDLLGSVMMTTGPEGRIRERYEYDSYGQAYEGSFRRINDLGYNGKRTDPTTGLLDYGFRDYAPRLGRFTTSDPIQAGTNWYAYVGGEPVNFTDAWGLVEVEGAYSPDAELDAEIAEEAEIVRKKERETESEERRKKAQVTANSSLTIPSALPTSALANPTMAFLDSALLMTKVASPALSVILILSPFLLSPSDGGFAPSAQGTMSSIEAVGGGQPLATATGGNDAMGPPKVPGNVAAASGEPEYKPNLVY